MHKSISTTALAVALLALPAVALADSASVTQTGAFVSITGGTSHFDIDRDPAATRSKDDGDTTGFTVLGGYRWVVARPFLFGVEGGYVNLGNPGWRGQYVGPSVQYDVRQKTKVDGLLIGVNGKWDLPYDLTVTARVGVAHLRARNDITEVGGFLVSPPSTLTMHDQTHTNRVYAGVGFGYDFDENLGLTLSYDRYSFKAESALDPGRTANVGLLGLTLEYRFW
ncbi:outer membrane beta-barrel protein [Luteibacter sp. PPL201]|jgi:hypothetical protein|uniref:Outer membrane beta-barrel protein n=1 Tax=Luteibacter sahnii TaxID=3021977 RepID=A0ABT6BEC4_9GAMM|nr:outer membrane beta-barrel protein [Luteibacter sp. PPL193]MDY1548971.1 outer membrane beta-barrel protein [Luteibacter sp. PPL193]